MAFDMRRDILRTVAGSWLAAALLLVGACEGGDGGPNTLASGEAATESLVDRAPTTTWADGWETPEPSLAQDDVRAARAKALRASRDALDRQLAPSLESGVAPPSPFTVIGWHLLGQRYGFSEFDDARDIARSALDTTNVASRLQLRLIDPTARPDLTELAMVEDFNLRVIATGLACDVHGAPQLMASDVDRAFSEGGYSLTHLAFAILLARDLGCPPFEAAGTEVAARILTELKSATGTERRQNVLRRSPANWDTLLEEISLLAQLGTLDDLSDEIVKDVLRCQLADGTWGNEHQTILGVSILSLWLSDETGKTGLEP